MTANDTSLTKILLGAFKLFIQLNLEKVTVKRLESSIGLTRGSIFYHFETKVDIFKATVDTLFFSQFDDDYFKKLENNGDINRFISSYLNPCQRIVLYIKSIDPEISPERAFIHFTSQSNIYYPDFNRVLKKYLVKEEEKIYNYLKINNTIGFSDQKLSEISLILANIGYSQILKSALAVSNNVPTSNYFKSILNID